MEKQVFYHSKKAKNLRFLKPISTKFTKSPSDLTEPSKPSEFRRRKNGCFRRIKNY